MMHKNNFVTTYSTISNRHATRLSKSYLIWLQIILFLNWRYTIKFWTLRSFATWIWINAIDSINIWITYCNWTSVFVSTLTNCTKTFIIKTLLRILKIITWISNLLLLTFIQINWARFACLITKSTSFSRYHSHCTLMNILIYWNFL